ncbi:gamma-glutamylcyclotransferase family protein [Kiloniella spongiae]|uniref:gamma-glutamylcyclotransferase family protein n=1 Tax=Kiloniella spongiae TaxID=1489064 RepID=UPI00069B5202|nr:gamma-glutamylcyclotransferase family protein [Kiloniella spongiae]
MPEKNTHDTTLPLFFFGSLMDQDVLEIVLGRSIDIQHFKQGVLLGYQCEREAKESYPVLIPSPGKQADVLIAETLSSDDIDRILFYETGEYDFVRFTLQKNGQEIAALGFATGEGIASSGQKWHLNIWQKKDKAVFLPLAKRFMEAYGKMTLPEALRLWDELVLEYDQDRTETGSSLAC